MRPLAALALAPAVAFALALACVPRPEQRPGEGTGAVAETWSATPEVPAGDVVEETDGGVVVSPAPAPAPEAAPTASVAAAARAEERAPDAGSGAPEAPPAPPVKLATEDPELRSAFQRAFEASRTGDLPAAEQELKAVVGRNPSLAYAWTNLGIVQERLGRLN